MFLDYTIQQTILNIELSLFNNNTHIIDFFPTAFRVHYPVVFFIFRYIGDVFDYDTE